MNQDETKLIVGTLLAAYPRESVTQESVEVYGRMLADLDFEAASKAVRRLLATRYSFPTIADVRRDYFEDALGLPHAEEAWFQVLRQGSPDDVLPSPRDPLVRETMEALGITRFDVRQSEKPEVIRGQFLKAYSERRARAITDANLGHLGEVSRGTQEEAEAAAREVDGADEDGGEGARELRSGSGVGEAAAERGEVS